MRSIALSPDPYLPLVAIAVGIMGGTLWDGPRQAGLTTLLVEALTTRTSGLTQLQLAGGFDHVGGRVQPEVTPDGILLRLQVLEDRVADALDLLAQIVRDPALADAPALERACAIALASLDEPEADPEEAGLQALRQVIYGPEHPLAYPRHGTRRTLRSLGPPELAARYRLSFRPGNVAVVLAGRITSQAANDLVQQALGDWKDPGGVTTPAPPPAPPVKERGAVHLLPRPGLAQTVILVGSPGLPHSHARYQYLRMLSRRVAGSAGGWLREIENLTYGVGTIDDACSTAGIYGARLAADARATGTAARAIVERYDAQPGGWFDIEKVVMLTREGHPFYSVVGRARAAAELFIGGLPHDHWTQLRQRLDEARGDELPEMTHEYLRSERMQVVLVGDPAAVRDQLGSSLGPITPIALATE